jgi:hypothetical protein
MASNLRGAIMSQMRFILFNIATPHHDLFN